MITAGEILSRRLAVQRMYWLHHRQAPTRTQDSTGASPGCCEVCGAHGIVCLDGAQFFCWDHYGAELRRRAGFSLTEPA